MLEVERESRAAAPKGSMTYAFTYLGILLLLEIKIGALRLGFGPQGRNLGFEAKI